MNQKEKAWIKEETLWKTHKALRFSAGGYEALMIPEVGANVIELKDNTRGVNILRTPSQDIDFEEFKTRPQVYGLPLLFPPNRIEDGTFKLKDKIYKFPINEPNRNNYIHGFIKSEKWMVVRKEVLNDEVLVEAEFSFDEKHDFYKYFPHKFTFKFSYSLSKEGLKQTTSVANLSDEEMPISIGFHTPFNIPFISGGKPEDYRVIASLDKRWEQNERLLPTEKRFDLAGYEVDYVKNGIVPLEAPIEKHYSLKHIELNGKLFKGAAIEDISNKIRVIYNLGEQYNHMVVWNDNANKNYICLEPQTGVINAPNLKLDESITGFKTIAPKEVWSEVCKIYVEDIK